MLGMEEQPAESEQADEQQKLYWRLRWLTAIQAFADTHTQRTRWLDPLEENPHFSFIECMCVYFDDVLWGEDDPYSRQVDAGILNDIEAAAVADFHALADQYKSPTGDDWDAHAILNDPAWQQVVAAAQQAQCRLLAVLTNSAEIEAVKQPEHWDGADGTYRAQRTGSTIVRLRSEKAGS
jgi:hypothetical protein